MRPIFYITRLVPDYRIPILEMLNDRLEGQLVVGAGHPPGQSSLHTISGLQQPHYRQVYLHNHWVWGERIHFQRWQPVFRQYEQPAALVLEESPRSLQLPWLLRYARQHRIGVALWGHFSSNDRQFDPEHHLFDRYRRWLARQAQACVCYTQEIAEMLQPHLPAARLFVARNTLDTRFLFACFDQLAAEGKQQVRKRLGLPETAPVLAFLGRLLRSKGTALLIETFTAVQQRYPDARLLVIGEGPERTTMQQQVAQGALNGVHFLGALPESVFAPWLFATDLMLIPGYLGLAVNHALCLGVPVLSQAAPPGIRFHSPEVAYVQHGINGLLTPYGDTRALVEGVETILAQRATFSCQAQAYARTHLTIEQMVDGLEQAIRAVAA